MQARLNHSAPPEPQDAPEIEASSEPALAPTPAPAPVPERPVYQSSRPVRRPELLVRKKRPVKRILIVVIAIAIVVLVAGFFTWRMLTPSSDGIDTSKYQAVFLANNTLASNVYFGRLERISDGYYKLTQVYYLQQSQATTDQTKDTNVTLTKMTTQLHGPEDALILPREQVLYYQNMRSDSKVVQAILQDNQKN